MKVYLMISESGEIVNVSSESGGAVPVNAASSSLMAAFFRRMHFRISFTVLVLCRTRCVDERCVNDTASVHDQTGLVKSVPNIVRQGFARRILLQKATEVQQCRCVRYLLLEEIAP